MGSGGRWNFDVLFNVVIEDWRHLLSLSYLPTRRLLSSLSCLSAVALLQCSDFYVGAPHYLITSPSLPSLSSSSWNLLLFLRFLTRWRRFFPPKTPSPRPQNPRNQKPPNFLPMFCRKFSVYVRLLLLQLMITVTEAICSWTITASLEQHYTNNAENYKFVAKQYVLMFQTMSKMPSSHTTGRYLLPLVRKQKGIYLD